MNKEYIYKGRKHKYYKGQKIGRLTVCSRNGADSGGRGIIKCLCDCGSYTNVGVSQLNAGKTTSCGCLWRDIIKETKKTHGMYGSPIYKSWRSMKHRCDNKTNKHYIYYGGKGIKYCSKWSSFEGFYSDMGESWEEGLTIDRVDPNGDYCKENCRWATVVEQQRNKTSNVYITYRSNKVCLAEFCNSLGLQYKKMWRLYVVRNLTLKKCLVYYLEKYQVLYAERAAILQIINELP